MINTFLFDLDGTLLPMNMKKFLKIYFSEMAQKLAPHIPPEKITDYVWAATKQMINNTDSNIRNMDVFSEHFTKLTNKDFEELLPIFNEFYTTEFVKTKEAVSPEPLVKDIINILKQKNYTIVVATNPLFPEKAILHRLEWAGLKKEDVDFITSYENMHACKPNKQYYQEILEKIDRKPQQCIMVGNDVQEDMIAGELGLTTFLLEDQIIHREDIPPLVDYKGSYQDLKTLIEKQF